ncbi:MAG: hypothetical protein HKN53_04280 [Maribacter sp.]|nr:hypothetical protein [Maribacter sp.]
MKARKGTLISISLIVIGLILECLYLGSDKIFFAAKFWLIGLICFIAGVLGLFLFALPQLLNGFSSKTEKGEGS